MSEKDLWAVIRAALIAEFATGSRFVSVRALSGKLWTELKREDATESAVAALAIKAGYEVKSTLGWMTIRIPRKLQTVYRVYVLADADARTRGRSDDDPYPDQVLATLTVPYVDQEMLTVFDDYPTAEAAQAAILEKSGMGPDNAEYVILPVSRVVNNPFAIKAEA